MTLNLPEPLVSVTPTGIFVEWHAHGIDIEVRIRDVSTYVLVGDRHGRLQDYTGSDVGRALSALCVMEGRTSGPVSER